METQDHKTTTVTTTLSYVYITYLSLSAPLQSGVFQKYLTMWNAHFLSEINTELDLNINRDTSIVRDVRLHVTQFICLTKVSKIILSLFCFLKLRFRRRWYVLPRQFPLREIRERTLKTFPKWPPLPRTFKIFLQHASVPRESCTCLNAADLQLTHWDVEILSSLSSNLQHKQNGD